MDGSRFDSIAKSFASPTRRTALLLGGIALCGIGGALGWSDAQTRPGNRKRDGKRQRRRDRERRRQRRKPGPPLYPDLQTLPPQDLRFAEVNGTHVLRFTNTVWNAGNGRLELEAATSVFDVDAGELYQNLYDRPIGGNRVKRLRVNGEIVYHPTHAHYHFADFASYQLLRRGEDGEYQPIGQSIKTSFCITDNFLKEGNHPRQYHTCNQERQGLTPGWRDTYTWNLDEQWVILADWPMTPGEYGLLSIANPDGLLDEGGGDADANNAATTYFTLNADGSIVNPRDAP